MCASFLCRKKAEKSALSKELFDARSSPLKARYSEKVFVFGFFLESRLSRLKENGPRATHDYEIEKISQEKALEKLKQEVTEKPSESKEANAAGKTSE